MPIIEMNKRACGSVQVTNVFRRETVYIYIGSHLNVMCILRNSFIRHNESDWDDNKAEQLEWDENDVRNTWVE